MVNPIVRIRYNMFKKCRPMNMKFFMLSLGLFSMYLMISYMLLQMLTSKANKISINNSVLKLSNVILHLDLKGSPPKLSYLESLLPKLKDLGVTGLLIEYEDMFPYKGKLVNLSATNAYKNSDLQNFLALAVNVGFDIIPLVQTFGHMEHVLKLEEFMDLREEPLYPDSICPSKPESELLIRDMLEQVILFHENVAPLKYFHIGGDEVYHINKCQDCASRKLSKMKMYSKHVRMVTTIVKELKPNAKVLLWDDMLRKVPMKTWHSVENPGVELVYWDYNSHVTSSHINMMKYHKKFSNIWIASAFKGADGRTATFPNLKNRFSNHLSWMEFIHDYKFGGEDQVYNFQGIILTGWSRYSHMDPICELFPVSIPSLVINLLLIKKLKNGEDMVPSDSVTNFFRKNLNEDVTGHLHCNDLIDIDKFETYQCYYDGSNLYQILENFDKLNKDVEAKLSDFLGHNFYSNLNNINMNVVKKDYDWCNETISDFVNLEYKMVEKLEIYYDRDVVNEYVNYKLNDSKAKLEELYKNLQNALKVHSWKHRYQ